MFRNLNRILRFESFSLLIALSGGLAAAANSDWKIEVENQKTYMQKITSCPIELTNSIDELIDKKQDSLPEHLRRTGGLVLTMDLAELLPGMPPEVIAKLQKNKDDTTGDKPPTFMSKTHAKLEIVNQISNLCDSDCARKITENVVMAVAFWKNICHLCTNDFMSFLSTSNRYFIDSRVATWLSEISLFKQKPYPLNSKNASFITRNRELQANPSSAGESRAQDHFLAFAVLTPDMKDTLCKMKIDGKTAPRSLKALSSVACAANSSAFSSDAAAMRISLLPDQIDCGNGMTSEFIACGHLDSAIDVSFNEMTYSFLDLGSNKFFTVGSDTEANESGSQVLIHEVGHWFGLPHINSDKKPVQEFSSARIPDVMQNSLGPKTCATNLPGWLLIHMTDKSYQDRFRAGGGLKRRDPKRIN
jgi:hypothetical protein